LLKTAIEFMIDEYTNYLINTEDLSLKNIAKLFFDFWITRIAILQALEKCDKLYLLLMIMNENISTIYEHVKGKNDEYGDEIERDYVLTFSIGGFWNVLIKWLHDGTDSNTKYFSRIIERAIKAIAM